MGFPLKKWLKQLINGFYLFKVEHLNLKGSFKKGEQF